MAPYDTTPIPPTRTHRRATIVDRVASWTPPPRSATVALRERPLTVRIAVVPLQSRTNSRAAGRPCLNAMRGDAMHHLPQKQAGNHDVAPLPATNPPSQPAITHCQRPITGQHARINHDNPAGGGTFRIGEHADGEVKLVQLRLSDRATGRAIATPSGQAGVSVPVPLPLRGSGLGGDQGGERAGSRT
ncbi:hypothetical protein VC83_02658 [Pseudogymnoascus destructans]|uniref:Uncharacterized protein n=1 Tax=Pseudogymnoascus destructans TaxID=655981 RepID=A0A177AI48_9PEZI|nr:uncharacterized protein VC83_02658 [Pseudogymnoascus destructans]OAF60971.1 hypothetical protein VC83_02658 [Pseudogymnoascus destructans]